MHLRSLPKSQPRGTYDETKVDTGDGFTAAEVEAMSLKPPGPITTAYCPKDKRVLRFQSN